MNYQVTNISKVTYVGQIKIKPNETVKVDKETFDYLKSTFEKFNMFSFKDETTKLEKKIEDKPKRKSSRKPKSTKE